MFNQHAPKNCSTVSLIGRSRGICCCPAYNGGSRQQDSPHKDGQGIVVRTNLVALRPCFEMGKTWEPWDKQVEELKILKILKWRYQDKNIQKHQTQDLLGTLKNISQQCSSTAGV